MKTLLDSLLLKRITILAMVILTYSSCKKGGNDENDPKGGNGHPIAHGQL